MRQRGSRTRSERYSYFDDRPEEKPGEPRSGTGCNMPGAVNGRSRRGGEKPRGRSVIDGVAAVGRRRVTSGSRRSRGHRKLGIQQGTKFQERKDPKRREVQRIRLGSAGTPKARPRWEAA
jgi:hypothetical protein